MKKLLPLICCLFLLATTKAQYVNIPDSNFRSFLIGKYPSCFNGAGQMDTTCVAIVNEDSLSCNFLGLKSLDGVQFFKKLTFLDCSYNSLNSITGLPESLQQLFCMVNKLNSLNKLPDSLQILNCSGNWITNLISLPSRLKSFSCTENFLSNLPVLPDSLLNFYCNKNKLIYLPNLPGTLVNIDCSNNKLTTLPALSDSLIYLSCNNNQLISLPNLPIKINEISCYINQLTYLPNLPSSLSSLNCSGNKITTLPSLPNDLSFLDCSANKLTSLPNLPTNYFNVLFCSGNEISFLPTLPNKLGWLECFQNQITSLPNLPLFLHTLICSNNNIYCLPELPVSLNKLQFDGKKVKCLPNYPSNPNIIIISSDTTAVWKTSNVCNPTNNPNHCQSFPVIKSLAFIDANNNNKLDLSEFPKHNLKLTLSNNNYSYTNNNGTAYISADSLGTFTLTATPPIFYNIFPPSYTHNFSTYDTLVIDTFALQASILKDSISIKITPTNWAARAGRSYPYLVSYENVGTTVLSNAIIGLQYDNSLLNYDSSSVGAVTNSGNKLSVNMGNLLPGQTGNFIAYFKVKTTAALSSSVVSIANISTNTVAANDTITTIIRGSYDPNDKQATPSLTLQEVSGGKHIDYTIRFQNTGTDTAFNVVIADTLDSKLLANQVQMVGSSHPCKTTVKDNIIFFELLDIMLPDSNVNKFGSNGFVSFKIKPIASVAAGTTIPNKAAIYFDYNNPVITKPANTIIQNPLPLQLLNFSAIPQNELGKILVYWNTANEVNTAYFIIETSSNGTSFKAVAEVAAKGIGSNSYFYSIDKSTVAYLRLKMVDKNGVYTYSNIIKLDATVQELNGIIVLQNPATHQLKLNVVASKLNNTNASIVNAQGKVVKRFVLQQGYQNIDISGIAAGMYYLQSTEGSKKFIVE